MEESNRHRRIKNRPPYDLRRKVLLKNFLREQMSPIPLSTSIERTVNHEVVHDNSTENEIVDIENVDSTSAMNVDSNDAIDFQSSTDSRMEVDDEDLTEIKSNRSTPFKSALMRDFTKITEIKLSRFNSLKRKTPSLSADAVKVIADKNSVHLESKKRHNKNVKAEGEEFRHKYNKCTSPWKRIELKKNGITKAKYLFQSSKSPFKKHVDKSKSSTLSKVRKMIAAVHIAIKGPKNKNMSGEDVHLDNTTHKNSRYSGDRFSKYGPFDNRFLINVENEENDEDIPDRVRIIKDIKKTQFCRKYKMPYNEESFHNRSILKDPNSLLSRLLRRKACMGPDFQEQERSSDISWSLNEIRKLEKSNKQLREENQLLSASLSSIMADVDAALGVPIKLSAPSHSNSNQEFNPCYEAFYSPRCKVLRSRSVQDRGERRREIRSRLSSRSMCHQQYSRIPPRTLYRAKPCIINPFSSEEVPLPYPKLPPALSASFDRSCAKSISRRSSMPERVSRRPLVNRRSSFTCETKTYSRQNLLSLPTESFY